MPARRSSSARTNVVEVAVQHALDVADLDVGAVVLDHRVGVQHVGADLRSPADVLRLALLLGDLLAAPLCSSSSISLEVSIFIAVCLLADCERSFWHCTTVPVGLCVIRTAESVLFTCWPPAPEAR